MRSFVSESQRGFSDATMGDWAQQQGVVANFRIAAGLETSRNRDNELERACLIDMLAGCGLIIVGDYP